jgi:hypothetical protein
MTQQESSGGHGPGSYSFSAACKYFGVFWSRRCADRMYQIILMMSG